MKKLLLCLGFICFFNLHPSLQASGEISLSLTAEVIRDYPETTLEAIEQALKTGERIYYGGSTTTHHLFFIDRTSFAGDRPWVFYEKLRLKRELLVVPGLRELNFTEEKVILINPGGQPRLDKVETEPVLKFKEF